MYIHICILYICTYICICVHIYIHAHFFGSGVCMMACMMARARATYVLNHFSRSASSSRAGSVFSVQVDHVVTVLKSCVMSFLSIVSSASPAPHITCFPT